MNCENKSCKLIQDRLLDYPEHTVPEEKAYIQRHLLRCVKCRESLGENTILTSLLQKSELSPPQELRQALIQQFRNNFPDATRKRNFPLFPLFRVAALFLFFLSAAFYLLLSLHNSDVAKTVVTAKASVTTSNVAETVVTAKASATNGYVSSKISNIANDAEDAVVRVECFYNERVDREATFDENYRKKPATKIITVTYDPDDYPEGKIAQIH